MKNLATYFAIAALAGFSMCAVAQDQTAAVPSLDELLKAQIKVAKSASTREGTTVLEPGTVFVVMQGGLLGAPPSSVATCASKFQDGNLHPPAGICAAMLGSSTHYFEKGTKLYVTKLDVNPKKNTIELQLIECDTCNGYAARSSFKSAVQFQFAPKFLDTAEPGQVMDVIGQVLGPDNGAPPPAAAAPPAQPGAPAAAPAQPQQIQVGDTPEQVEGILGPPDTKLPVGTKLIYVYKTLGLKITFVGNKVADVQ